MKNNPNGDEWLERLTRELIAVARKCMPGHVNSFITTLWDIPSMILHLIEFVILPHKRRDTSIFGFFFGVGFADPKKLLEGEGKRIRHVKIWSVEDAKNPALAKLVAATWTEAHQKVAQVHARMRK